MSEIPERIEREMFEIRSRMAPDVQDLRQHVNPKVVSKQVSTKIRDRIRGTVTRAGRASWTLPGARPTRSEKSAGRVTPPP